MVRLSLGWSLCLKRNGLIYRWSSQCLHLDYTAQTWEWCCKDQYYSWVFNSEVLSSARGCELSIAGHDILPPGINVELSKKQAGREKAKSQRLFHHKFRSALSRAGKWKPSRRGSSGNISVPSLTATFDADGLLPFYTHSLIHFWAPPSLTQVVNSGRHHIHVFHIVSLAHV